jgi:hypothetical protein
MLARLQLLVALVSALVAAAAKHADAADVPMPPQLDTANYVACMRNGKAPINMDAYAKKADVGVVSYAKLQTFLTGYPDVRPFGTGWIVDAAHARWAKPYVRMETAVVRQLRTWSLTRPKNSVTPSMLFNLAMNQCTQLGGGQQHPLCAAITLHNVMRALGRWARYGKNAAAMKKALPPWYWTELTRGGPASHLAGSEQRKIARNKMRDVLIPLQRCLPNDAQCVKDANEKWGQWYQ